MDSSIIIQILILVLLLGLSAFFSSAETALVTISDMKVISMMNKGQSTAFTLKKIKDNPEKMLSAILIGNNIINLSASSLATTVTIRVFGSTMVGVATGVLTILILIFGEITPKTMAQRNAEKMAVFFATPIAFLMYIMTPLIFIVNHASYFFIRLLGGDMGDGKSVITEDELRTIVDVSHKEGLLENEERKMIKNVFDFGDLVVREIMTPRIDTSTVEVGISYTDLMEKLKQDLYTRTPVVDETDMVVGVINIKDFLRVTDTEHFDIRDYMRPPLYTFEYKNVQDLLVEMRKTFENIAIVLDEYGQMAGIVTIEDMIEEIVGEIRDEYDQDEANEVIKITPYEYLIDASISIEDLNEKIYTKFESEEYESIAGYLIEQMDKIPKTGDFYETEDWKMVVESMDKARIDKVRLFLKGKTEKTDTGK